MATESEEQLSLPLDHSFFPDRATATVAIAVDEGPSTASVEVQLVGPANANVSGHPLEVQPPAEEPAQLEDTWIGAQIA